MGKTLIAATLGILLAGPAAANHDRQLERWILDHVAARIGDLRGGFAGDARPALVTAEDLRRARLGPDLGFRAVDPVTTATVRAH